ncbi:hypothetical protein DXG01_001285 [Tephrocybe rancida]|nr:hypothetical protein DXG01_001285 [Tephrocybe rancida]
MNRAIQVTMMAMSDSPSSELDTRSALPMEGDPLPQETASTPAAEILNPKDGKYYLEFVSLVVEDRLFKVPKHHFLRYSGQFQWMQGIEEDTPHTLENIDKADFQALLKLMYPLYTLPDRPGLSSAEWTSILKLASLWMMIDLRNKAIEALHQQTWLQKIILGRAYGETNWLHNGYTNFVTRQENLSIEEAQDLGLEAALKLMNIREERLQRNRDQVRHNLTSYHYDSGQAADSYSTVTNSYESAVDEEMLDELTGVRSKRGSDAVERVIWAKSQNNLESLRLAYIELAERHDVISFEEASRLGLATTIKICRAREKSLQSYPTYTSLIDPSGAINSTFEEEFSVVSAVCDLYRVREKISTVPFAPGGRGKKAKKQRTPQR